MKNFALFSMIFGCPVVMGQEQAFIERNLSIDKYTDGALTLPVDSSAIPLVIFIQGSGPTNRDVNQPMMKNDGIKKISRELAQEGIASFRFDQRKFKERIWRIQNHIMNRHAPCIRNLSRC